MREREPNGDERESQMLMRDRASADEVPVQREREPVQTSARERERA